MEREKFLTRLGHNRLLGRKCSIGVIKDFESGDYYPGCTECERPLKILNSGGINLRIKRKGSPIS